MDSDNSIIRCVSVHLPSFHGPFHLPARTQNAIITNASVPPGQEIQHFIHFLLIQNPRAARNSTIRQRQTSNREIAVSSMLPDSQSHPLRSLKRGRPLNSSQSLTPPSRSNQPPNQKTSSFQNHSNLQAPFHHSQSVTSLHEHNQPEQ